MVVLYKNMKMMMLLKELKLKKHENILNLMISFHKKKLLDSATNTLNMKLPQ